MPSLQHASASSFGILFLAALTYMPFVLPCVTLSAHAQLEGDGTVVSSYGRRRRLSNYPVTEQNFQTD